MNENLLAPIFLDFANERANQKTQFGGEWFPAQLPKGGIGQCAMIKNERQYRITRAWVQKFTQTLAHLDAHPEESAALTPLLKKAERDGLASQIESLRQELQEYEALRSGQKRAFQLDSFEELPRTLIKARIASGLSQKDLAGRLGLKEQQIQRYEATEYASASMERVSAVIHALGLSIREEVSLAAPVTSSA